VLAFSGFFSERSCSNLGNQYFSLWEKDWLTKDWSWGFMSPFHSTSEADFCVLKIPCVLKIFSKPRLKSVLRPQHRSRVRPESIFRGRSKIAPERLETTLKMYPFHVTFRVEQFPLYTRWLLYNWKSSQDVDIWGA
jgi:hypothetical protein